MIAAVLALWLQVPDPEELVAKACPERARYAATADEQAILGAVAEHYRKFESSVADRHRNNYNVTADYARHAVPSKKSPQVLLLDSMPMLAVADVSLEVELQRHGVPRTVAEQLIRQLKARNATPVEWSAPAGFVPLSCREVYRMMMLRPGPAGRDLTNAAAALMFARPAFDDSKQYAAVLSINNPQVLLQGKWESLELSLLKRNAAGAWQLEWDTILPVARRQALPAAQEPVRPSDLAIFDAVLARVDGPVRVVNQTRVPPNDAPAILQSAPAPLADLRRRGKGSTYLGGYAPKRGELVQRETLDALDVKRVLGNASAAFFFALPGYDGDTAVVTYTLVRRLESGFEKGEGAAVLQRSGGVWRVTRDDFRRWISVPR